MLHVFVNGDNSFTGLQYTWITKVSKSQQKSDTFNPGFLVSEIILLGQDSAK